MGGILLVGIVVPFVASGFQTLEVAYALIFAMAILGLNMLTGYSGQISLGHGAFVAIGAFTTAIGIRTFAPAVPGHDPTGRAGVRHRGLRHRPGARAPRRHLPRAGHVRLWRGHTRPAQEAD